MNKEQKKIIDKIIAIFMYGIFLLNEKSKPWESRWHRVNEKLLTINEAKALGKEYEDKGYEVKLSLSEF